MFSLRKVLQALYYMQSRADNSDKYSRMYLLKLLYFADRYHIRHFGMLASGDKYKAMQKGPVAYFTYNNMKGNARGINTTETVLLSDILELDENSISVVEQGCDELSESCIEALDFALKTYSRFSHSELSEITHDYPEWINKGLNEDMNLMDFFENPKDLKFSKKYGITEDPFAEDEDFLQAMKDDFNATSVQYGAC